MALARCCLSLLIVAALAAATAAADHVPVQQDELHRAVELALPLIQKGAVGHRENRTCFACHNQGIAILAMTTARSRGFAIDEPELERQLAFIADFLLRNRDSYLQGKGQGGQVDTAGYALLSLELGLWRPDPTTSAVTEYLLLYQKDADHFRANSKRPPSEASPFTTTYVGLQGLKAFATPEQRERAASRIDQIREWLVKTPAADNEDRVFRLWGLHAADAPSEAIVAASEELAGKQREDGGWAQLDSGEPAEATQSDAYATGTALVALHRAGGMPTTHERYQRGLRYLLEHQLADGSWHVKSRSKPFQTYFETGFPHGNDQFISAAASAWATTAIALACEPKK